MLRDPYVIILVLGTIRSPRAAERRQRQPVLSATGTHISVRQDGAAPCSVNNGTQLVPYSLKDRQPASQSVL